MTLSRPALAITVCLAGPMVAALAVANSFWNHTGSIMRPQASGAQRFFY